MPTFSGFQRFRELILDVELLDLRLLIDLDNLAGFLFFLILFFLILLRFIIHLNYHSRVKLPGYGYI